MPGPTSAMAARRGPSGHEQGILLMYNKVVSSLREKLPFPLSLAGCCSSRFSPSSVLSFLGGSSSRLGFRSPLIAWNHPFPRQKTPE